MVEMKIAYTGQLRCTAEHGPSQVVLQTDAPVDNMGRGETFSPTDLLATALGTCILTTMAIVARRASIELDGASVTVEKEMISLPSRRVGKLSVEVHIPLDLAEDQRALIESAGRNCPVYKSLHPDIDMPAQFRWGR